MEGAKDPDEYIKKFGAVKFRMLLDDSFDANNFMLDRCENGLDLSTQQGQVEYLNRASKMLAKIESPLEREVYISRTAQKSNISVDVLKTHIDSDITSAAVLPDRTNPEASQHLKESKAEETIICWLLKHPENVIDISNKAPPDIFVTHFNKKIYTGLINKMTEYNMFTISMLSDEFSIEELGKISGMEAKKRDIDINADVFADCINILQNYHKNPHKTNGEDLSDEDLLKLFQSKAKKQ